MNIIYLFFALLTRIFNKKIYRVEPKLTNFEMSNFFLAANPKFEKFEFLSACRKHGISGFMRIRNEGEFLEDAIFSALYLVDELIIVYNNCQDNSEEIIKKFAKLYPDRIKVYNYIPIVYPPGSKEYLSIPPHDKHSLVYYYDFALSKTTRKIAIKIDGDMIFDIYKANQIRKTILDKVTDTNAMTLSCINLIYNKGEACLHKSFPICGTGGDLSAFKVNKIRRYFKDDEYEILSMKNLQFFKIKNLQFVFYHTRFLKKDFGFDNYSFKENPNSPKIKNLTNYVNSLELISFNKFLDENDIKITPPPPNSNLFSVSEYILNRDHTKDVKKYMYETLQ